MDTIHDDSGEFCSTGIYHIHSDFSFDGTNSLEEIADWARTHGLQFVLLTEHDQGFDQEKFESYRAECSKYGGDVLLVPGIEYEVIHCGEVIHIGAIGVPEFLDESVVKRDILSLVEAIHRHGGLAVLNHPNDIKKVLGKRHIEVFDFIEMWNTKFDCEFAPNLQMLRWLNSTDHNASYLVSADIHNIDRFNKSNIAHIYINNGSGAFNASAVVGSIKERRYRCQKGDWLFSANGNLLNQIRLCQVLPIVCMVKKRVFRLARACVPTKYRKKVYKFVNRSWIR